MRLRCTYMESAWWAFNVHSLSRRPRAPNNGVGAVLRSRVRTSATFRPYLNCSEDPQESIGFA
jgi:hypothetical protein